MTVHVWPLPTGHPEVLPKLIKRPCEYGLDMAIQGLETQLGTIEAYNRVVASAVLLKQKIDSGQAQAQNSLFATSVRG